jgi:hypothetical protein
LAERFAGRVSSRFGAAFFAFGLAFGLVLGLGFCRERFAIGKIPFKSLTGLR